MKTNISTNPKQEAGECVSQILLTHNEQPILFLLSGGSALSVLECIQPQALGANLTVVMMDERFTDDTQGNNFLQLQNTSFFTTAKAAGVEIIESTKNEGERHEQFAERISTAVDTYLRVHTDAFVVGLFGIGEDGHTASIFPTTEQDFIVAYSSDNSYIAITRPQEKYPFRISITPTFIEEKISEVVLYAVGSKKCDNILSYMHTKNFGAHEIPALIPARHPESTLFTDCEALI
ncbi:MAG: Glucosamine-6-phosphate isomerase/6-phosphogluconolactonase [Candidatus Parcubacteria bacterium]|jgi:6-phosphogluconolactonase/glucosamine-6-phosphate isomerase/deaminase